MWLRREFYSLKSPTLFLFSLNVSLVMSLNGLSNYFEYFKFTPSFDVDLKALHEMQVSLQAEYHPDRYVSGTDQQKRISVQQASLINEAYETLKDPVKRAHYLLQLVGMDKDDNQTTSDTSFLMEQISFREAMSECKTDANPLDCIDGLSAKLNARFADFSADFKQCYQDEKFSMAQESARKMMFVQKILHQLNDLQIEIEDELM